MRSFARVFCVSQERWVVDGADRQQVRNTLNVHDSGLQAALSFTWRCIVGNGGSSSLSEDDSTRSRTNFQQAQSAAAQLANAWRKQQCFVVKKSYGRAFFFACLLDSSTSRGPFSFWRRLPDTDPHLPHKPFFAFPNPEHFPVALALDLLIRPPVLGEPHAEDVVCHACHPPPHAVPPPTIDPLYRHFVHCMHGIRLHTTCHDPAVQALVHFLDAIHGSHRVIAERGGLGGHRGLNQWMQGPGAGLRHIPDIVLENYDGVRSFTLIDVKTFDPAGASHINTNHTDRTRLAAHRAIARHSRETEYGPLPERMRLIILPISIFGAIGTPGQAFISELSRRVGGSVPPSLLPHASWATPRVGPMIRMALTHAVRRGLAASIHTHWRRENLVAGGEGDEAVPPAPPAGGPPPGFMPIWGGGIFGHAGIHGGPYGVAG